MTLKFTDNDIQTISSKIKPDIIYKLRGFLNSNTITALENYSLVITGTVGSGKSTVCESLMYIFEQCELKVNPYPEFLFINQDLSESILKRKSNNDISTFTFQSYILDAWCKILDDNIKKPGMKLFERCVDDSVLCFCNIANKNKDISEIQLLSLYERLKNINDKYDVPTYFDSLHFTEIQSSKLNFNLNQIVDIIISDIRNNVNKRIIGLSVSDYDSHIRIQKRSREGEDGYTENIVKIFNTHYKKLFKLLHKQNHLDRFIDIGKLL